MGLTGFTFWQPRVMRHFLPGGGHQFAIHEAYFAKDGVVQGYTEHALSARMPSVEELEAWIRSVLPEAASGVVCGDLGYTYDPEDLSHWLEYVRDKLLDYEE